MPLVRVQVRNEYGLGQPELYREANKEDPKTVLEGVTVAGLVGILRQLGDLAEFAAEVFHGIQEQVMTTSSRSRKLMARVQCIESAFSSLENAILHQKSHLHFAYTSGTLWHACLGNKQNHFIYSDLPQFIMDSYEECRHPPRLHLLDKFDSGGPGSCLKRYSDPTFFSRASAKSVEENGQEVSRHRKPRQSKKKRTLESNELSHKASISNCSGRTQFASLKVDEQISPEIVSTFDVTMKSDLGEQCISFDSRTGSGYIECVFHPTQSMKLEEQEPKISPFSGSRRHSTDIVDSDSVDECGEVVNDEYSPILSHEQTGPSSSCVTWDEMTEVVKPMDYHGETAEMLASNFHGDIQEKGDGTLQNDQMDFLFGDEDMPKSISDPKLFDDIQSEISHNVDGNARLQHDQMDFLFDNEDIPQTISSQKLLDDSESEADNYVDGGARLRDNQMDFRLDDDNLPQSISDRNQLDDIESEIDSYKDGGATLRKNQIDFQFDDEDLPKSISDRKLLDDIESETDNYMDALNTIETESETDIDCQTKRDVEEPPNQGEAPGEHGLTTQYLDHQHSNFDEAAEDRMHVLLDKYQDQTLKLGSCTTTNNSSDIETSFDQYLSSNVVISSDKSLSPQCYADEELPQMVREFSNVDNPSAKDLCGDNVLHGLSTESGVTNLQDPVSSEPDSMRPMIYSTEAGITNLQHSVSLEPDSMSPKNMITNTSSESPKFPSESSSIQSVKFWTNGGLLGLEPSKPPDFSSLNSASQDALTRNKGDVISPSSQSIVLNGDGDGKRPDKLVQNSKCIEQISSKCSTLCHNGTAAISNEKATGSFSLCIMDAKSGKCSDSCPINGFNNYPEHSLRGTNAALPKSEQQVDLDLKTMSTAASQRDYENGSETFGISNRFLVNGFQRKISLVHGEKSDSPSSRKSGVETKSRNQSVAYQTFSGRTFKGYFESGSPINSPSSSPPLQHMKISFQPVNGIETNKLKLRFPDGSFRQDSSRDMLPSFQLVPEPNTPQHNNGSDSDDDTFCRSSPYRSDDCVSHHSYSKSEQWESEDDTPSRHENELYDALCRISLTEAISSSAEPDRARNGSFHVDYGLQSLCVENCLEPSESSHSPDLPNLSTLNPLFEKEMRNVSHPKDFPESHSPKEHIPLAPPLPPAEWRAMRSYSDMTICGQDPMFEALNHAPNSNVLESSRFPQLNPSAVNQQQNSNEAIRLAANIMLGQQKFNGKKEVNQVAIGRGADEKEDFLQQIRRRSFNLRRTIIEKPTVTPGPAANVKVTAILEKVNAIRQAVGSDDGEDDLWSDT
ncbi:hypothetical protein NMG60_11014976 [Bertholletia excelsa]